MKVFVLLAAAAALSPIALAQTPRAKDGHPDLGGVWGTAFLTPLERPPGTDLDPSRQTGLPGIPPSFQPSLTPRCRTSTLLAKVTGESAPA
jgi:hypothetical protein